MINFNGKIEQHAHLSITDNRAFLYADALFDTLLFENDLLVFLEDHYFRLLASMRELRMEIPMEFTQDFWEDQIKKTITANKIEKGRVRTSIFRDRTGFYLPETNKVQFIIQVNPVNYHTKDAYLLGTYRDNYTNTNSINNLKTTNRIQNVLASIFAKENQLDNCIVLNHKKQIAEAIHSNIFVVYDTLIKTPALSEGCINGIVRKKIIELIDKLPEYKIVETAITPFELLQASEVFLTNSVIGIQPVTQYKRKTYATKIGLLLAEKLTALYK